jgi:hypothetical protein
MNPLDSVAIPVEEHICLSHLYQKDEMEDEVTFDEESLKALCALPE